MDASDSNAAIFARTTARYRGDRFSWCYVAAKLRTDPVHADLLALGATEHFGRVADLGCGRGQIALALLEGRRASAVEGCDWAGPALTQAREASVAIPHGHAPQPGPALTQAREASAGLDFMARAQDLAHDPTVPPCDTVLLVDILYLLGRPAALALLAAAAAAARSRVLVRTHDPTLGWRGRLTVGLERLWRPILPNTGLRVDPIPPGLVVETLEASGFAVSAAPCWRGTPFSNVLLVARRRMAE